MCKKCTYWYYDKNVTAEVMKMGRRLSLHILLPIEGYEEDKVYDSEEIALRMAYSEQEPDNVYYRKLKEKSVYASFDDIVRFACENIHWGKYIISPCIQIIGVIV